MAKKLLYPDDVRALIARRYQAQHRSWLGGAGSWPQVITLASFTERDAAADIALLRGWVDAWSAWTGVGTLVWGDAHWTKLGKQRLPARFELASADEVAVLADDSARFGRARQRYDACVARWPVLAGSDVLPRNFDVLADYDELDYQRLAQLITWLLDNPSSGHFLRQLPVAGLDTKWIDRRRRALVVDLLCALRGDVAGADFYDVCGLRRPPHRVRVRLLCPELRRAVGGVGDIEARIDELAGLSLAPRTVLIVENLESGLALPDIPGCVAFMKLGHSVSSLVAIPWLRGVPVVYWGDIDTHGLAILDRARGCLGGVRSVMMDEGTLLAQRPLWAEETSQWASADLPHLSDAERELFEKLRTRVWGRGVRLEQERIPWSVALAALLRACG